MVEASRRLADLFEADAKMDDVRRWRDEGERTTNLPCRGKSVTRQDSRIGTVSTPPTTALEYQSGGFWATPTGWFVFSRWTWSIQPRQNGRSWNWHRTAARRTARASG